MTKIKKTNTKTEEQVPADELRVQITREIGAILQKYNARISYQIIPVIVPIEDHENKK
jgi:hypothetical protein